MVRGVAHQFAQAARRLFLLAGALVILAGPNVALAMKVDPSWAARQAAQHASVTGTTDLLASNYSHGPHTRAAMPNIIDYARQVRGVTITPASASWKVDGLKPPMVKMLIKVQLHFGRPLHMVSGCRDKRHNRRVGGARRSQHLECNAADFEIPGVSKFEVAEFLKKMPGRGGVGLYCRSSYVHLDLGPKREWSWSCKKRKKRKARRKVAKLKTKHKSKRALKKAGGKRRTRDGQFAW